MSGSASTRRPRQRRPPWSSPPFRSSTRVRGARCQVVAEGCRELAFADGLVQRFALDLARPEADRGCPPPCTCPDGDRGRCLLGDCASDAACADEDLTTPGLCVEVRCSKVVDAEGDGAAAPLGCDDRRAGVGSGEPARCGEAVDHDCDGAVDEVDG